MMFSAYLIAWHLALSVLAVSGLLVYTAEGPPGTCLSLRDISRRRIYRRPGISSGGSPTVPRFAVCGYVGRICSLCFRATSKEAVRLSLLSATCSRRRIFIRLFWRICTEESVYQQPLWTIAIRFGFYGDARQIRTISQMLAPGTYLTDWRSNLFVANIYLDIKPKNQGFRYKDIEFIYGGRYGL